MSVLCDSEMASKQCIHCGHHQPITHFRRVYRDRDDLRHSECNHCRKANEQRKRLAKRRSKLSKGLSQLRQTDCPITLQVLANRLIAECGGLERMVHLSKESFEEPGRSGFRQQLIASVIHLVIKADEQRKNEPQMPDDVPWSTEELNSALRWRLEKIIKDKPSVAVDALRRSGWTLIPPGE